MAGPPIWMVERGDAGVWIFGETVGLRDDRWLTKVIREAVTHSRVMWREADREQIERSPSLATYVLADVPLRERLNESQRRQLADVAASMSVDPATLDALRPWAAGQVLEQAFRERAGLDEKFGVDAVLTELAVSADVPMRFEYGDAEATLTWFAAMDEDLGTEYLMWTIERVVKGPAELERQAVAWRAGDLGVAEAEDAGMRRGHPRLYERMMIDRNRDWVPRIRAMLEEVGWTFVLVGGGHLVGPDSVLAMLRRAGMEPHRVT